jgi:hypothetical protein
VSKRPLSNSSEKCRPWPGNFSTIAYLIIKRTYRLTRVSQTSICGTTLSWYHMLGAGPPTTIPLIAPRDFQSAEAIVNRSTILHRQKRNLSKSFSCRNIFKQGFFKQVSRARSSLSMPECTSSSWARWSALLLSWMDSQISCRIEKGPVE